MATVNGITEYTSWKGPWKSLNPPLFLVKATTALLMATKVHEVDGSSATWLTTKKFIPMTGKSNFL